MSDKLRLVTIRESKGFGAVYPTHRLKRLLAMPEPKTKADKPHGRR